MKYNTKERVLVLLASFNGALWLEEQLRSLTEQLNVDIDVLISDDGSSDKTIDIIRNYEFYGTNVHLLENVVPSGSAGQNFINLIKRADSSGYGYVALADQDDVWLNDKIASAISILGSEGAAAYSSSVTAFWSDGRKKS
ncbi:glycosyltransferase [Robbsia andropogonis]|uniref:glycosyltransferase n=1 Tax=Robbsia andropogonis TaxID=28092 RepID=UPI0020A20F45|nr:glycosyltransferase [Robbsia andropogonis]MCP1121497.1 glycosyltransferase [Robbsia andropogonis]MCP1131313.1 glycosyltransferase [Robbsia andropogonis]